MPARTYQTYEQDTRDPDLRTLHGVFLQGWDLNWVLTGTGRQRLEPQAVIEWVATQKYPPSDPMPVDRIAEEVAAAYVAGTYPVPSWVREELPAISKQQAEEIVAGAWHSGGQRVSQEMSGQHLSIAVELADEALKGLWLPRGRYYDLVALIYDALTQGLPYAEIIAFARPAAVDMAGGPNDDGGDEVGGEGEGGAGRREAGGNR